MIRSSHRELERTLSAHLKSLPIPDAPAARSRTLDAGWRAMEESLASAPQAQAGRWSAALAWKVGRVVATAAALVAAVSLILPHWLSTPAWAVEQSIAAIEGLRGLHISGSLLNERGEMQDCELWMRANRTGRQSQELLMIASSGTVSWVAKGSTYHYVPSQKTVFYEEAVTAGMSQWPGPRLLELISKAGDAKVVDGRDPLTGRKCLTVTSSVMNAGGPQSWVMSFDAETKRPISFKTWSNLDRSGPPVFWAKQVTYSQDLSDSQLTPNLPEGIDHVKRGPTIPEHALALLLSPRFGLAVGEMGLSEAAQEILRRVYTAIIQGDTGQVRKYCPIVDLWSDELIKGVLIGTNPADRIKEVISIGPIEQEGRSQAGAFVVVPVTLRRHDDSVWRDQIIVQFRGGPPHQSCVVHGPYGQSVEVD